MELSVIIPCLNGGATLAMQLEALAGQKWPHPWELIISDNGSTDDSIEVAKRYENRFNAFRIIDSSDKKRQSHALNVGVRAARADKVAFCDADDEVSPGWLASIGDALSKYCVVHGQFRFDKFNDPKRAERAAEGWKDGLIKKLFLPGGGAGNLGIQRWAHDAIGGFAECIPRFEDSDYYWRLQLEGFKLHFVPEAIVQVRLGRVNPTLSEWYRRYKTGAAGKHWLYRRFKRFGMLPNPLLKKSFSDWTKHVMGAASGGLLGKQRRTEWLKRFVQHSGALVGEIQGRIFNPCKAYRPSRKSESKKNICL